MRSPWKARSAPLALTLAAVVACAPSAEKRQQQVETCATARAAYGNDVAACLIVRYNWQPADARVKAILTEQREREFVDSILQPERKPATPINRHADSIAQAECKRTGGSINEAGRCYH